VYFEHDRVGSGELDLELFKGLVGPLPLSSPA